MPKEISLKLLLLNSLDEQAEEEVTDEALSSDLKDDCIPYQIEGDKQKLMFAEASTWSEAEGRSRVVRT